MMAALVDQLRQLHRDLQALVDRDPEQEVRGPALPLMDAVISEARNNLPVGSTLGTQMVEIISVAAIESGEPVRVADALIIVGQLLAVYEHQFSQQPKPKSEARRRLDRER
jgi:hypothetical protein